MALGRDACDRGKPSGRELRERGRHAAAVKKGGLLKVGTTGASVQVDPQLAYVTTAWWLEYATAAKLFNYPDKSGPCGQQARTRGGFEVHRLERWQDLHLHDPEGLQVQ